MIAGSLGALVALRFVSDVADCAAAAIISPVSSTKIQAPKDWQFLFEDNHVGMDFTSQAARIRTPLIIAHGLRDEVAPAQDTSKFISYLPHDTPYKYLSLPEEGHNFPAIHKRGKSVGGD